MKYLEYLLGNGKVQPLVDKAEVLAKNPIPKSKQQVQVFLCLAGYYRRFVPTFALFAAFFTDIVKNQPLNKSHGCPSPPTSHPSAIKDFRKLNRLYATRHYCTVPSSLKNSFYRCLALCCSAIPNCHGQEHPIFYIGRKFLD